MKMHSVRRIAVHSEYDPQSTTTSKHLLVPPRL